MKTADQDEKQIAAVIERYRRGFATLDVEELEAIWDREYGNLIYIPAEAAKPVRNWTGIAYYYETVTEFFERVEVMTVGDVSVDVLDDVAYAFCGFHFEGEVEGRSEPHHVDGRATFVFRRKSGTWKVIHYHESLPPGQYR